MDSVPGHGVTTPWGQTKRILSFSELGRKSLLGRHFALKMTYFGTNLTLMLFSFQMILKMKPKVEAMNSVNISKIRFSRALAAVSLACLYLSFQAMGHTRFANQTGKPDRRQTTTRSNESGAVSPAADAVQDDVQQLLVRSIADLSHQVEKLGEEVRLLRRDAQHNSLTLELILSEERLERLETRLQETLDNKSQLDAREADIQRRMKNIQGELVLRGGLRRDESEAAIRSELQRGLDEVHAQQTANHQRSADLQAQIVELRHRVEVLTKRLDQSAEKPLQK